MGQTVRFQETLRRLAMIDEAYVADEAGLGVGLVKTSSLDPKTSPKATPTRTNATTPHSRTP